MSDEELVIEKNGRKIWFKIWFKKNKKVKERHRDGDLPAIIREGQDGACFWFQDDKLHRYDDKPAAIYPTGKKVWFQRGFVHRDGGLPAVVNADGSEEWWMDGVRIK